MKQEILGLHYDAVDMDGAVALILALHERPGGHSVVTAGTEHVMMARRQPELPAVFNDADVMLADGIGVVKASRIVGRPLPERVGGIDVTARLFERWAALGKRVFLLGGAPQVAAEAARRLKEQHPALIVCGTRDGFGTDDGELTAFIGTCQPDVLLVCLGVPKQELWMMAHKQCFGDCVLLGLGGSLDVWAGNVKRAAPIFIKMNAEWLGRLLRQPTRIKRMVKLPGIYWAAWRDKRTRGRR